MSVARNVIWSLAMSPDRKHKFVWGWLRVVLGQLQIWLAIIGFIFLCVLGLTEITYAFVMGAGFFTIISLILYRGKGDPRFRRK